MTTGERIRFREVLRQARDQSLLSLAATNATIESKERGSAAASLREARGIEHKADRFAADQESGTLLAINGALELLHDRPELYGVCEECGAPISPARLLFFPWSSSCLGGGQAAVIQTANL